MLELRSELTESMICSTYPRFTASDKSVASATFLICSPNASKLSEDNIYMVFKSILSEFNKSE